jgi:hypothetical protein
MDLGIAASERAHQTASCIKRWIFFTGFLGALVQGEVESPYKSREIAQECGFNGARLCAAVSDSPRAGPRGD